MSDEEKDLRDEVKVEAQAQVEAEVEAKAEAEEKTGAEGEVEAVPEDEAEAQAEVEAEVEADVAEPAGTALATKTETGPTSNERIWAALAHASVLLTFILGVTTGGLAVLVGALVPLIIWLAFRDRSRFVTFHAMQATVFQLASVAAWVGLLIAGVAILIPTWIVTVLLLVVLIGFLLLPVVLVLTVALPIALVVMPLAVLVYGLYGAFEVYGGRDFRYWLVADWIEKRGVESPSTELAAQPAS
jgi:uncharacterized Tic20 family protein